MSESNCNFYWCCPDCGFQFVRTYDATNEGPHMCLMGYRASVPNPYDKAAEFLDLISRMRGQWMHTIHENDCIKVLQDNGME